MRIAVALVAAFALVLTPVAAGAASPLDLPGDVIRDTAALPAHPSAGPTEIADDLRDLIAAEGPVEAVVTTWERDGLAVVADLGIVGATLRHLPMMLVPALTAEHLDLIAARPEVRSVWLNEEFDLYMEDTTWIVGARDAWGTYSEGGLEETGYTGEGVEVAVIDTGADGRHADFGNLVEFCETRQALTGDRASVLCSPFDPETGNAGPAGPTNDPRLDSVEDFEHGSHVAGTVAGTGAASGGKGALHSTIGIAPDAKIRAYSANIGPTLATYEILAAYDDMTWKKLNGFNGVVAVNNSWGGGAGFDYDPHDPVQIAVNAAYEAGILSVFAAGNSGPEHDTLSRQCVNPHVVCVGATTKPDAVVGFSSRGRPSGPADTNRDGEIDDGDVAPGNHDRAIAQALDLGVYRPALVAPGVNINSMPMGAVTCYEDVPEDQRTGCYVALNGTSMATPHVTGATAVIAQAYAAAHGEAPRPAALTDILERSAVTLPGYGAEEQGAGRLDVARAVELAGIYPGGPELTLGTPIPPYAEGLHPGAPDTITAQAGCTGTLSWSTAELDDPVFDPPPADTARFGQHTIDVPEDAERLRVTVSWDDHPGANLYLRLWRPGVDPDAEREPAGPDRVFPDNEALGLVFVGTERWLDVRAPEPGEWILRVYHRAGGAPASCNPDSDEQPKQVEGVNYDVTIETPIAAEPPSVAITSATVSPDERFVELEGTADYPAPWDGITSWEVPGSGLAADPAEAETVTLHFRGNLGDGCGGTGSVDVVATDCPYLSPDGDLSGAPAASWTVTSFLNGSADRNIYDSSWTWWLEEETTIGGPMTVVWWAECGACSFVFEDDWDIRVWADGDLAYEERISAGVELPNVPERLERTVTIPTITASERIVLHVDPVYIDSQSATTIWYDSQEECPASASGEACDSYVLMPLGDPDAGEGPDAPQNVRTTDLHDPDNALLVTWKEAQGASGYEIHRSTDPAFTPDEATLVATTEGEACAAPDAPSWPTASREGLCWTDSGLDLFTTHYYRVVAVDGDAASDPSLLGYGTPTNPDRQVKVKVDRVYGPRYWEYATLTAEGGTAWSYTWDRLGLDAEFALDVAARSFTQGIGSAPGSEIVDPAVELFVRGAGQVPGEGGEAGETAASFTLRLRDEGGASATFRLAYRDREAGVRVDGRSVEQVACTTTADGTRCELDGTADVTRDGETPTEDLRVVAEDNGTPGRGQDVFELTTDSDAGGGTLMAGGVQIDR